MQGNLPELLSPKVDVIFKLLFGDERYCQNPDSPDFED
jgi:hypothetical protein